MIDYTDDPHRTRMNRQQRRAAERRNRKKLREIQRPGYHPANDPGVRKGVAKIVRAVDFALPDDLAGTGLCLFRSLVALEAMRYCNVEGNITATLKATSNSAVCSIASGPRRDVIAFCGPGNAGATIDGHSLFHVWISVGDCIADFSVGDWPRLRCGEFTYPGAPKLGPVQWTIPQPPPYWWRPCAELAGKWCPTGTPPIGEAWYGPFNGNPVHAHEIIKSTSEELGPQISAAVNRVLDHAAGEMGIEREPFPRTRTHSRT